MPLNPNVVLDWPFEPVTETYDAQRTIIYALGIGAGATGAQSDLDLVYERDLKALPTMAVVLASERMWMDDPRTGITFTQILHGEQGLVIHRLLPSAGTVLSQSFIDGLYDKGAKGAVLVTRRELRDAITGEPIATVRATAFLRADGGFGGRSEGQPAPHTLPSRTPDLELTIGTRLDQAMIYRLSGDLNPLHIDPEVARKAGFDRPILHGLCSYGIVGRALIEALCGGRPERLKRLDVRFSAPVYPGETLVIDLWREAAGRAAFRVRVRERDIVVLNNGLLDFRPEPEQ